jgi:predicted O-methyltransferase YrrM
MLTWLGDDACILDNLAFRITFPRPATVSVIPERFSERTFLVEKPRWLLEQYVDLLAMLRPRNIFEIGIRHGGSTVFLSTLAMPEKYVAIDLADHSLQSFGEWLRNGPLKDQVVAHFGVDQSDGTTLRSIAAEEFDGAPLDLVIDDASHILAPTRATFEALFPRLRPGGVYVIEDWETQHRAEAVIQNEINSDPTALARFEDRVRQRTETLAELKEPLTRLLVQIVLAAAYTDIVDDIRIRHGSVMIRRGHENFDQENFAISDFYGELGRELLQQDPGWEPTRTKPDPRPAG